MIGDQIRKYRERRGWDQVELAAEIDVQYKIPLTQRIVSQIEQGHRTIRDKELYAIAQALGVTPDVLFGLKDG